MAAKNRHFSKGEAINFGWSISKKNVLFFISLFVAIAAIYVVVGLFQIGLSKSAIALFVLSLIRVVIGVVISMGTIKIALEFVDKKNPKISDLFYTKSILNYFLVSLIRGIIVFIGFILLVIPGIIFSIKLQFVTYLVVDKKLGALQALSKSWEMTKGVKWNLFLFWLALLGINILGFLFLIIGLVITIPLSMVATAYVYRKLLASE